MTGGTTIRGHTPPQAGHERSTTLGRPAGATYVCVLCRSDQIELSSRIVCVPKPQRMQSSAGGWCRVGALIWLTGCGKRNRGLHSIGFGFLCTRSSSPATFDLTSRPAGRNKNKGQDRGLIKETRTEFSSRQRADPRCLVARICASDCVESCEEMCICDACCQRMV